MQKCDVRAVSHFCDVFFYAFPYKYASTDNPTPRIALFVSSSLMLFTSYNAHAQPSNVRAHVLDALACMLKVQRMKSRGPTGFQLEPLEEVRARELLHSALLSKCFYNCFRSTLFNIISTAQKY